MTDPDIQSSKKFMAEGLQTDAGLPPQCDEGPYFMTFRVGLFGLDKWYYADKTVANLAGALDRIGVTEGDGSCCRVTCFLSDTFNGICLHRNNLKKPLNTKVFLI